MARYTINDFDTLRTSLLGPDGLWDMLHKDLLQQLEMPSHFDQSTNPELGNAPNLSVMMIALGGLESIARLANINDSCSKGGRESVKSFADRYFSKVDPIFISSPGKSNISLIWEAYRNGGIHRFFPKMGTLSVGSLKLNVSFRVDWHNDNSTGRKRKRTLLQARAYRTSSSVLKHEWVGADSILVRLCAELRPRLHRCR